MTATIADRVRKLVKAYFTETMTFDPDLIEDDTDFGKLDLDSLDIVDLTVLFEDEFGVELTNLGDGLSSIADIIKHMEGLQNG